MLDHLLVDVIDTIRASFDRALLQRQAVEERFQVDVFLGDVSWETSYSLPGEEQPPRVRADVSVDWPTWSQTSYRSWSIGEPPDELPEVVIEVALRVQRMAEAPDTEKVMAALPDHRPARRPHGPGPHRHHDRAGADRRRRRRDGALRWAAEATYEGSVRFSEQQLEDPSTIEPVFDAPHPLDRLHAHHAGRPPLHLPARRGGRRLTRISAAGPSAPSLPSPSASPLAACGSSAPAAPPPSQGLVLDRPTPQHVPLVDQHGRAVSLAALRGKVVVLAPFLSLCQDECPLITGAFISLQRDLQAAGLAHRVVFVEATVDPGRDSVARLAAYQREFGADWDLWTGTPADVAAFWKPFGVEYQTVPEEQPPKIDWFTGTAADLRRRPHRRLHPHRRRRPRALRRRHRSEPEGRSTTS